MISVAMCTYNGESYIEEQLESLIKQTRQPDEIVICDDGSTDRTLELIEKFFARANNFWGGYRIYRNEKQLGWISNFKKVTELCSGEIIFWCDQDDVWFESKIERMSKSFSENSDCVYCFCDAIVTDENLKTVRQSHNCGRLHSNSLLMDALENRTPFGCCIALKKEILQEWKEPLLPHDWFATLYAHLYGSVYEIQEPLQYYRRHGKAVTVKYNGVSAEGAVRKSLLSMLRIISAEEWYKDILLLSPCYEILDSSELWKEKTKEKYPEVYEAFLKKRDGFRDYMRVYTAKNVAAMLALVRVYLKGNYRIRGNTKAWIADVLFTLCGFWRKR